MHTVYIILLLYGNIHTVYIILLLYGNIHIIYLYLGILVQQKVVNLLRWRQLIMSNVLGLITD